MKITGAIFDMDGTLLNSMDYWGIAAEEYLKSKKIKPASGENRRFLEQGMKACSEYWKEAYGLKDTFMQTRAAINSFMKEKYESDVSVKDGAIEMLEALYEHGVKMCLATATDRSLVEAVLKRLGIEKYFSRIFTCSEVGVGKAFPVIYERALEFLGTAKDTTYVFEDAYYALVTAHNAGFKTVGVYDKNVFVPVSEILPLCDIYLDEDSKYRLDIE